jgi:hypothetical protein
MPVPVSEIKQALEGLGLERPEVKLVRLPGNRLRLAITAICHVDRGAVATLPQAAIPPVMGPVATHELTDIPSVGPATAAVLRKAGIKTPADIAATPNDTLSQIGLRPHTIPQIRRWLADEGYNKE